MQKKQKDQYSFGVVCRRDKKYLAFSHKGIWMLHKGHFQHEDLKIVTPYDDFKVIIQNKLYEFPNYMQNKAGSMVIAAVRQLMQESGYILPSQALRLTLQEKYQEQGKLLFINEESILGVQQQPYKFTNRKGNVVTKYVTYFFAQIFDQKPKGPKPKHQNWFTKQQWLKLKQQQKTFQSTIDLILQFQALLEKNK